VQTDELIEHINNEKTEISNVKSKLESQTLENLSSANVASIATPLIEVPAENVPSEQVSAPVQQVTAAGGEEAVPTVSASSNAEAEQVSPETSWLDQVMTK
jgi:hypothetical protein